MQTIYYIKRFFAGLLLIVFAISITPKRFLHDAFADHVDKTANENNKSPYQVSHAGFNCDNDNLVAESVFINDLHLFSFPHFNTFSPYIFKDISFNSLSKEFLQLRGPPANI